MKLFRYQSGEEVRVGDKITFHGEPGEVEFVVTEKTGDPAMDWYIQEYPGGGIMIKAKNFGSTFMTETDEEEDLILVSRSSESSVQPG